MEHINLHKNLLQVERREALCRHLSESESSLEMEEERQFNEAMGVSILLSYQIYIHIHSWMLQTIYCY